MVVFKRLRLLVKKNIQLVSVLVLIAAGIVFTLIATYLYYWLRSPITLAAIWIIGLFYVYIDSFLIGFRKKYKIDTGKYNDMAQYLMKKPNLSMYRLYIKERKIPNASAISFGSKRSIILTSSLCQELPPEQIEAVLAHEVGHHVYHDAVIGIIFGASVLDGMAFFSVWLSRSLNYGVIILTIIASVLAVGALMVGTLYSRHRENRADEYAASLTGKPQELAKALENMRRNFIEVQGWTIKDRPPLWISLFTTHAPISKRVEILRHSTH